MNLTKNAIWIGGTVAMVFVGVFILSRIPVVNEMVGLQPKRITDVLPGARFRPAIVR